MDTEAINQFSPGAYVSGLSAFEPPIPADASPALASLVGKEAIPAASELEERLAQSRLGVVSSLFRALRLKHPPTAKHCLRVALGCSVFASYLKLDDKTREQIEIAALLHDIGKLGVPDQILNKPDRLDANEYQVMEQHMLFAVHILESFCDDQTILDIVRYSSTWYDGSRPAGCDIKGDALPIGARILAIQNAYDAMTTDLVYRQALPRDRAIAELFENSPTQFDPKLVSSFCEVNSDASSHLQSEVVRRWVQMSNESADGLWSFTTPINQGGNDSQTIFQQRLLESMHDGVIFVDMSARIMVWNRGAEELTGLSKESVHHKQWQPQIVDMRDMEGNAIKSKSCPLLSCVLTRQESIHRLTLTNRGKKSRVAVNVHLLPVRDATDTCHGAIMILHDVSPEYSLEARVQNLHTRATRDALTGVGNRAEFDRRHSELVASHAESGDPLGLVICDIDHFKLVNDTYGHQAGDAALIEFASLIDRHCRGNDLVARYGGEEFVLICPGCTASSAEKKAEEIRRSLAATVQPALNNTKMTASFGVTDLQAGDTPETMLKRADEGLYEAKEAGRNRVILVGNHVETEQQEKRSSWFSWTSSKQQEDKLVQKMLKCSVPVKVVAEKLRGFVSDNNTEVIEAHENSVSLAFGERSIPGQRRQTDRPFTFTMRIDFKPNVEDGFGTLIDVTISGKRGRDRRLEDVVDCAEQLLKSLKAYLIAEDY